MIGAFSHSTPAVWVVERLVRSGLSRRHLRWRVGLRRKLPRIVGRRAVLLLLLLLLLRAMLLRAVREVRSELRAAGRLRTVLRRTVLLSSVGLPAELRLRRAEVPRIGPLRGVSLRFMELRRSPLPGKRGACAGRCRRTAAIGLGIGSGLGFRSVPHPCADSHRRQWRGALRTGGRWPWRG